MSYANKTFNKMPEYMAYGLQLSGLAGPFSHFLTSISQYFDVAPFRSVEESRLVLPDFSMHVRYLLFSLMEMTVHKVRHPIVHLPLYSHTLSKELSPVYFPKI